MPLPTLGGGAGRTRRASPRTPRCSDRIYTHIRQPLSAWRGPLQLAPWCAASRPLAARCSCPSRRLSRRTTSPSLVTHAEGRTRELQARSGTAPSAHACLALGAACSAPTSTPLAAGTGRARADRPPPLLPPTACRAPGAMGETARVRFRHTAGDIGPLPVSTSSPVSSLKEQLLSAWPAGGCDAAPRAATRPVLLEDLVWLSCRPAWLCSHPAAAALKCQML